MDRRLLVGGVFLLALVGGSLTASTLLADPGDPVYTPDTLAGLNETENVTGSRARAIITELHRDPSAVAGFHRAKVVRYGTEAGPQIVLYVSIYNHTDWARANISKMVERIRGSPRFQVANRRMDGTTVFTAEREGVIYVFFSHREAAYWVTYSRNLEATTPEVVSAIIDTYRESRRPWFWPV
ncbi:MAG: hypothetical protein ABEJ27_07005 [Halodesulfurarchaeum sp.]